MDEQTLRNIRDRTDAKLRYARIHFEELEQAGYGGSDFERAHLESCLFHLIGARDAFLAELLQYYGFQKTENLTLGKVRELLATKNRRSTEIAELYLLENDQAGSWYSDMKKFRDHVAHNGPAAHHFSLHIGGGNAQPGEPEIQLPFVDEKPVTTSPRFTRSDALRTWHEEMAQLLGRLRENAIQTNNLLG